MSPKPVVGETCMTKNSIYYNYIGFIYESNSVRKHLREYSKKSNRTECQSKYYPHGVIIVPEIRVNITLCFFCVIIRIIIL